MPDELLIFLTAMTPIGELRAAIPLGLTTTDLPLVVVVALAIAGNLAPIPFLIVGLRTIGEWVERMHNPLGALLRWRTQVAKARYEPMLQRYGPVGLALFVGMPLPLTGAWTGVLLVWALRMPVRQGLAAVAAGVLMAAFIVTGLALAGIGIFTRIT